MKNIGNPIDFFDNDDEKIKEYEILKKFKSHNILKERVDLYKDFTLNLLYKVYDTYLGIEYIKTVENAKGHYNWCFGKVADEFYDQELDFYRNDKLYEYFLNYYIDQFYSQENQPTINDIKNFWIDIFNYKKQNKRKNEFDALIELYEIFDESLNVNAKLISEN